MLQAMAMLPENLGARLILAGNFMPPELEKEVSQLAGWDRVEFVGWQSREGVARLLARARAGLTLFHPCPHHLISYPNKLFEYMSAGVPVIASDFPHFRAIVEGEGCGVLVDPLNPKAISRAIRWLLEYPEAEDMGKRGRQAVHRKYNWALEAQKLRVFYQKLLETN